MLRLVASISMHPRRARVTLPQAMVMGTVARFLSPPPPRPAALYPSPPPHCTPVLASSLSGVFPGVLMPLACSCRVVHTLNNVTCLSEFLSICRHPSHECQDCIFHHAGEVSADAAFPSYCTLYIIHQTSFLSSMHAYSVPCAPVCHCQRLVFRARSA